jgi:hypothetical protein
MKCVKWKKHLHGMCLKHSFLVPSKPVHMKCGKTVMLPIFFSELSLQLQWNLHISYVHPLQSWDYFSTRSPFSLSTHFSHFAWDTLCQLHKILCWRTMGPVTNVCFTYLKMTNPLSNWANIYGILSLHTSQVSLIMYPIGALCSK